MTNQLLFILGTVVTDWITSVGVVLGVPATIYGIFKLFLKDKDKEERLRIAESQVNELRKQTSQFELQTGLMAEANALLAQQLRMQTEIFAETKTKEEAKAEYEKQKRKNDIKPRFAFHGASGSGKDFTLKLVNQGGNSEHVQVESLNAEIFSMASLPANTIIESGHQLVVRGVANNNQPAMASQAHGKIALSFTDIDGIKYVQEITKSYNGFQVANPYEDNN